MKKIINDPAQVVTEMCEGIARSNPYVEKLPCMNCIVKRPSRRDPDKVALVSLGGSGHEPAHAGYVGFRGLDAAACGAVFSSPSADQIAAAARAVAGRRGVLFIVKNYTGDILNTEMAQEYLSAEGISSDKVIVNDDVAVEDSTYTTGRRGIVGTVFVHHVAGVLSTRGLALAELKAQVEGAVARIRSAGVSLSPCTIPSVGKPGFQIADDEMEWFMGIHGEPGIERGKIRPAREIAGRILDRIHADMPFVPDHRYAVIVNGCGGTPLLELYILFHEVAEYLDNKQVQVAKAWVGNFVTSLEMLGASISVFALDDVLYEVINTPSCIFRPEPGG